MAERQAARPEDAAAQAEAALKALPPQAEVVRAAIQPTEAARLDAAAAQADRTVADLGQYAGGLEARLPGAEEAAPPAVAPAVFADVQAHLDETTRSFEQAFAGTEATTSPALGERYDNVAGLIRSRLDAAGEALANNNLDDAQRLLGEADRMLARFGDVIETERNIAGAGKPPGVSDSQWNLLLDGIEASLLDFGTSPESGSQLRGAATLAAAKLYADNRDVYNLDDEAVRGERFRLFGFIIDNGQSAKSGREYMGWETQVEGRTAEVLELGLRSFEENLAGINEQLRQGRIGVLTQMGASLDSQIASETVETRKAWLQQLATDIDTTLERINTNQEVSTDEVEALRARYIALTTGRPPVTEEERLQTAKEDATELRGRGRQSDRNAEREGTQEWCGQQALLALDAGNLEIAELAIAMGKLERAAKEAGSSARDYLREESVYYDVVGAINDSTSGLRQPTAEEIGDYATTVQMAAADLDIDRLQAAYARPRTNPAEEERRQRIISAADEAERRLSQPQPDLEGAQRLLRMANDYAGLLGEAGSEGWRSGWGGTIGDIESALDAELTGQSDAAARFQAAMGVREVTRQGDELREEIDNWGEGRRAYLAGARTTVEETLGKAQEFAAAGMMDRAHDLLMYAAMYIDSVKRLGRVSVENPGCVTMAETLAAIPATVPNTPEERELKTRFARAYLDTQSTAVDAGVGELERSGGELQSATPAPSGYVPLPYEMWTETHPGVPLEEQPPAGMAYARSREEENQIIADALATARRRAEAGDVRGAWTLIELVRQYYGGGGYYGPTEGVREHRDEGWRYRLFTGELPSGYLYCREAMLGAIEAEARAAPQDDRAHRDAAGLFDKGAQTLENTALLMADYATFSEQYRTGAGSQIEYERTHSGASELLTGPPVLERLLVQCGDAARRGDVEAYRSLQGQLSQRHQLVLRAVSIQNFGEAAHQLEIIGNALGGIRQAYEGAGIPMPADVERRIAELERKRDALAAIMQGGLEAAVGAPPPTRVEVSMEERGAAIALPLQVEFPAEEYAGLLSDVARERRTAEAITRGVALVDQQIEVTAGYIDFLEHQGREGIVSELRDSLRELQAAREFMLRGEFRTPEEELPFEATDVGGAEGAYSRAMKARERAFESYSLIMGDTGVYDLHMRLFRALVYPRELENVEAQERHEQDIARLGRGINTLESAILPIDAIAVSQIMGGAVSGGDLDYYHSSWGEIRRLVTAGTVPSEDSLARAESIMKEVIDTAQKNAQYTSIGGQAVGLLAGLIPGIGPYVSLAIFEGMAIYGVVDEWDRGHGIGGVSAAAWENLALISVMSAATVGARLLRFAAMPAEGAELSVSAESLLGHALELERTNLGLGLGMGIFMTKDAIEAAANGDMLTFASALTMALFPVVHMGGAYVAERAIARGRGVAVPLAIDETGAAVADIAARTRVAAEAAAQRAGGAAGRAGAAVLEALTFEPMDKLAFAYEGGGAPAISAPEMPAGRPAAPMAREALPGAGRAAPEVAARPEAPPAERAAPPRPARPEAAAEVTALEIAGRVAEANPERLSMQTFQEGWREANRLAGERRQPPIRPEDFERALGERGYARVGREFVRVRPAVELAAPEVRPAAPEVAPRPEVAAPRPASERWSESTTRPPGAVEAAPRPAVPAETQGVIDSITRSALRPGEERLPPPVEERLVSAVQGLRSGNITLGEFWEEVYSLVGDRLPESVRTRRVIPLLADASEFQPNLQTRAGLEMFLRVSGEALFGPKSVEGVPAEAGAQTVQVELVTLDLRRQSMLNGFDAGRAAGDLNIYEYFRWVSKAPAEINARLQAAGIDGYVTSAMLGGGDEAGLVIVARDAASREAAFRTITEVMNDPRPGVGFRFEGSALDVATRDAPMRPFVESRLGSAEGAQMRIRSGSVAYEISAAEFRTMAGEEGGVTRFIENAIIIADSRVGEAKPLVISGRPPQTEAEVTAVTGGRELRIMAEPPPDYFQRRVALETEFTTNAEARLNSVVRGERRAGLAESGTVVVTSGELTVREGSAAERTLSELAAEERKQQGAIEEGDVGLSASNTASHAAGNKFLFVQRSAAEYARQRFADAHGLQASDIEIIQNPRGGPDFIFVVRGRQLTTADVGELLGYYRERGQELLGEGSDFQISVRGTALTGDHINGNDYATAIRYLRSAESNISPDARAVLPIGANGEIAFGEIPPGYTRSDVRMTTTSTVFGEFFSSNEAGFRLILASDAGRMLYERMESMGGPGFVERFREFLNTERIEIRDWRDLRVALERAPSDRFPEAGRVLAQISSADFLEWVGKSYLDIPRDRALSAIGEVYGPEAVPPVEAPGVGAAAPEQRAPSAEVNVYAAESEARRLREQGGRGMEEAGVPREERGPPSEPGPVGQRPAYYREPAPPGRGRGEGAAPVEAPRVATPAEEVGSSIEALDRELQALNRDLDREYNADYSGAAARTQETLTRLRGIRGEIEFFTNRARSLGDSPADAAEREALQGTIGRLEERARVLANQRLYDIEQVRREAAPTQVSPEQVGEAVRDAERSLELINPIARDGSYRAPGGQAFSAFGEEVQPFYATGKSPAELIRALSDSKTRADELVDIINRNMEVAAQPTDSTARQTARIDIASAVSELHDIRGDIVIIRDALRAAQGEAPAMALAVEAGTPAEAPTFESAVGRAVRERNAAQGILIDASGNRIELPGGQAEVREVLDHVETALRGDAGARDWLAERGIILTDREGHLSVMEPEEAQALLRRARDAITPATSEQTARARRAAQDWFMGQGMVVCADGTIIRVESTAVAYEITKDAATVGRSYATNRQYSYEYQKGVARLAERGFIVDADGNVRQLARGDADAVLFYAREANVPLPPDRSADPARYDSLREQRDSARTRLARLGYVVDAKGVPIWTGTEASRIWSAAEVAAMPPISGAEVAQRHAARLTLSERGLAVDTNGNIVAIRGPRGPPEEFLADIEAAEPLAQIVNARMLADRGLIETADGTAVQARGSTLEARVAEAHRLLDENPEMQVSEEMMGAARRLAERGYLLDASGNLVDRGSSEAALGLLEQAEAVARRSSGAGVLPAELAGLLPPAEAPVAAAEAPATAAPVEMPERLTIALDRSQAAGDRRGALAEFTRDYINGDEAARRAYDAMPEDARAALQPLLEEGSRLRTAISRGERSFENYVKRFGRRDLDTALEALDRRPPEGGGPGGGAPTPPTGPREGPVTEGPAEAPPAEAGPEARGREGAWAEMPVEVPGPDGFAGAALRPAEARGAEAVDLLERRAQSTQLTFSDADALAEFAGRVAGNNANAVSLLSRMDPRVQGEIGSINRGEISAEDAAARIRGFVTPEAETAALPLAAGGEGLVVSAVGTAIEGRGVAEGVPVAMLGDVVSPSRYQRTLETYRAAEAEGVLADAPAATPVGRVRDLVAEGAQVGDAVRQALNENPPRTRAALGDTAMQLYDVADAFISGSPPRIRAAQERYVQLSPQMQEAVDYMITGGSEYRTADPARRLIIAEQLGRSVELESAGLIEQVPRERLNELAGIARQVLAGDTAAFQGMAAAMTPIEARAFSRLGTEMLAAQGALRPGETLPDPEIFAAVYASERNVVAEYMRRERTPSSGEVVPIMSSEYVRMVQLLGENPGMPLEVAARTAVEDYNIARMLRNQRPELGMAEAYDYIEAQRRQWGGALPPDLAALLPEALRIRAEARLEMPAPPTAAPAVGFEERQANATQLESTRGRRAVRADLEAVLDAQYPRAERGTPLDNTNVQIRSAARVLDWLRTQGERDVLGMNLPPEYFTAYQVLAEARDPAAIVEQASRIVRMRPGMAPPAGEQVGRMAYWREVRRLPEESRGYVEAHFQERPGQTTLDNALTLMGDRRGEREGTHGDFHEVLRLESEGRVEGIATVNGYYDPATGRIIGFGVVQYVPPEVRYRGVEFHIDVDLTQGKIRRVSVEAEAGVPPALRALEGMQVGEGYRATGVRLAEAGPAPQAVAVQAPVSPEMTAADFEGSIGTRRGRPELESALPPRTDDRTAMIRRVARVLDTTRVLSSESIRAFPPEYQSAYRELGGRYESALIVEQATMIVDARLAGEPAEASRQAHELVGLAQGRLERRPTPGERIALEGLEADQRYKQAVARQDDGAALRVAEEYAYLAAAADGLMQPRAELVEAEITRLRQLYETNPEAKAVLDRNAQADGISIEAEIERRARASAASTEGREIERRAVLEAQLSGRQVATDGTEQMRLGNRWMPREEFDRAVQLIGYAEDVRLGILTLDRVPAESREQVSTLLQNSDFINALEAGKRRQQLAIAMR